jgi:hypothetical protein
MWNRLGIAEKIGIITLIVGIFLFLIQQGFSLAQSGDSKSDFDLAKFFFYSAGIIILIMIVGSFRRRRGMWNYFAIFILGGLISVGMVRLLQYVDSKAEAKQSQNKLASSAPATEVFAPFLPAYEVSKAKLGNPISLGELAGDMPQQHAHERAMVIWIEKPFGFYKLPNDRNRKWEFEADPAWDDEKGNWDNAEQLIQMFKPPKGKNPPYYGVASHWAKDPENWAWIGWLTWKCLYHNTLFIQRFEQGIIIGPLRVSVNQDRAQVVVILNDGTWEPIGIPGQAPPHHSY